MRMKRLFAAVLTVAMLAGTLPGAPTPATRGEPSSPPSRMVEARLIYPLAQKVGPTSR